MWQALALDEANLSKILVILLEILNTGFVIWFEIGINQLNLSIPIADRTRKMTRRKMRKAISLALPPRHRWRSSDCVLSFVWGSYSIFRLCARFASSLLLKSHIISPSKTSLRLCARCLRALHRASALQLRNLFVISFANVVLLDGIDVVSSRFSRQWKTLSMHSKSSPNALSATTFSRLSTRTMDGRNCKSRTHTWRYESACRM